MQQPVPVTPTEKAQISIVWTTPQPPCQARFATLKKGKAEFAALKKAWQKWLTWEGETKQPIQLHDIDGDMFITTIDLSAIQSINFIDIEKRSKFIPYQ